MKQGKFILICILTLFTLSLKAYGSTLKEEESAAYLKYKLTVSSRLSPMVSEMRFNKETEMTVTVAFKDLGKYRHSTLVFEHFYKGLDYVYESVHLSANGNPDMCYGYGTSATVGKHKPDEILFKFVKNYDENIEEDSKGVKRVLIKKEPEYKRAFSFIFKKSNFDNMDEKLEEDKRTIKFSIIGDLWNQKNYNCCSYAHKVLGYCGINITFNDLIKSDKNFEAALKKYANANPKISKIFQ